MPCSAVLEIELKETFYRAEKHIQSMCSIKRVLWGGWRSLLFQSSVPIPMLGSSWFLGFNPSSGAHGHCMHMVHINTPVSRVRMHIKFKFCLKIYNGLASWQSYQSNNPSLVLCGGNGESTPASCPLTSTHHDMLHVHMYTYTTKLKTQNIKI